MGKCAQGIKVAKPPRNAAIAMPIRCTCSGEELFPATPAEEDVAAVVAVISGGGIDGSSGGIEELMDRGVRVEVASENNPFTFEATTHDASPSLQIKSDGDSVPESARRLSSAEVTGPSFSPLML
jgi:hypothetical protein